MTTARLSLQGSWPEGGSMWYGRNPRRHGGLFFIGLGRDDYDSVTIQEADRKRVAGFLRRFANRLDPPEARQEAP